MNGNGSIPDAVQPVMGFRAWRLTKGGILRSVHFIGSGYGDWLPGTAYEAVCSAEHQAPAPSCRCGVYAARSLEDLGPQLLSLARDRAVILGRVLGWGRV